MKLYLLLLASLLLTASAPAAPQTRVRLLPPVPQEGPVTGELTSLSPEQFAALVQEAAPRRKVMLFDVSDLVDPAPPVALEKLLVERDRRRDQTLRLAELIVDKLPHGAVLGLADVAAPGILRVEGDEDALAYVADFLEAQRRMAGPLVVELTLIELPRGGLAGLGIEGSSALLEDDAAYRGFLERLQASDASLLSAPRLAVSPRETAGISTTSQVAYVADYEVMIVEPGHQEILDPVIDVIEEGTWVELTAVPMPGGVVEFDVQVNYAELERPIPTHRTRVRAGEGGEVEISLPEVSTVKLNSLLALRPGGAALLAAAAPDAERDFVVLVHLGPALAQRDAMVDELFASLTDGSYAHRWFPPLEWSAIPALLERGESLRRLGHVPSNPLASQVVDQAFEGSIALWLVEGLREQGNFPSLTPWLVRQGEALDPSPEAQRRLLEQAARAYRSWWALDEVVRGRTLPLAGSGLAWH